MSETPTPTADGPTAAFDTAHTGPAASARVSAAAMVQIGNRGIQLRSFEELMRFANYAVQNGAAPKGMTAGQAALAIQAGLEMGLGPLGGLRFCTAINGLIGWRGEGVLALLVGSPVVSPGSLNAWVEGEGEQRKGVAVALRKGYAQPHRSEFSVADARRAGLWEKSGPWSQYPDRQLKWRAIGFLGKDYFSDILGGFPLADEIADYAELPEGTTATDQRQRIEAVEKRAAELPPAQPDPLFQMISQGKKAAAPAVIDLPTAKEQEQATLLEQLQASVDAGPPRCVPGEDVGPPEEPVPVAAPKPPARVVPITRCDHREAIQHLTPLPVGRNVVCSSCTLTIKKFEGPMYDVIDGPPPVQP